MVALRAKSLGSLRAFWIGFVLALAVGQTARSQEARYLSLKGPGTASVFWAEGFKTAYITDSGRYVGAADPELKLSAEDATYNQGVLAFLRKKGVDNLVITCSHPHADHMDGLKQMIEKDPKIFEFETIYFVDSDHPKDDKKGVTGLEEVFKTARDKLKPPKSPKVVERISATKKDAFGIIAENLKIQKDEAPLLVSNFEYDPKDIPASEDEEKDHPHGRCVITHYTTTKERRGMPDCRYG